MSARPWVHVESQPTRNTTEVSWITLNTASQALHTFIIDKGEATLALRANSGISWAIDTIIGAVNTTSSRRTISGTANRANTLGIALMTVDIITLLASIAFRKETSGTSQAIICIGSIPSKAWGMTFWTNISILEIPTNAGPTRS